MNERIKQLAKQSGFGDQWFEEHSTGCSLPKPLMLREFAEALVRECAGLTLDYKSDQYYNGWCDHAEEILIHFGFDQ